MVLTIAVLDFTRKVHNWTLGRADLQLRLSSGIYCSLPTDCGCMITHSGLMLIMPMVMTAMVMMAMMMVWVMVIIIQEALRQVGWLCQ
jgi:hypothetical protein